MLALSVSAYDAAYQGESVPEFRELEAIIATITDLTTLKDVNPNKIGVHGYAHQAAMLRFSYSLVLSCNSVQLRTP